MYQSVSADFVSRQNTVFVRSLTHDTFYKTNILEYNHKNLIQVCILYEK